jgi:hypothetical protein
MVGLQDTSFRVNRMKHLFSNLAMESGSSSPHSRRQYSWTTLSGLLSQMIRYISCFFFFFTLTSCQSIRVVECPEFRQLCMVLRETLIDDDIPRRFKMREAIMKRGQKSFEALKYDLSVSFSTFFFSRTLQIDIDQPSIAISRANQFYSRCLGKLQDDLLLGCDCSLDCPRCHKWAP